MLALSIQNLEKKYKNGPHALKDINLSVKQGDFFALLGPNGAGKTTLIGIISSLVNKTAGQIRVFDHDIDHEPEQVKSAIGIVPQEFNFMMFERVGHVVRNQGGFYGLPSKLAWSRANTYLKQLNLWEKRKNTVRMLSGGMKRRLMIARALVHQPQLLILDEPTAGVDIEIRQEMWEFLRELNERGTTIILTTHYLEEAESLCRNIAIIDQGQILANTSMSSLLGQLKLETVVLYLQTELREAPQIPGYASRLVDSFTIEVDLMETQNMNDLFSTLSQQSIYIARMKNKRNRLEELFLQLIAAGQDKKNDNAQIS